MSLPRTTLLHVPTFKRCYVFRANTPTNKTEDGIHASKMGGAYPGGWVISLLGIRVVLQAISTA